MDDRTGVVNDVPDPSDGPPVDAAYQSMIPLADVAPSVMIPSPHRVPGVVLVIVGDEFTVAVTGVRVAVMHVPTVAST